MKHLLLFALVCICAAGCCQVDTGKVISKELPTGYSRERVKIDIENNVKGAIDGVTNRDTFRNQMKVLYVTVFFTIIGIALTKGDKETRRFVLPIVISLCVLLDGMDTYLIDLNDRSNTYADTLHAYVLKWEMLDSAQVDAAYHTAANSLECSTPWRKLILAVGFETHKDGVSWKSRWIDWGWYLCPILVYIFVLKKGKRMQKDKGEET